MNEAKDLKGERGRRKNVRWAGGRTEQLWRFADCKIGLATSASMAPSPSACRILAWLLFLPFLCLQNAIGLTDDSDAIRIELPTDSLCRNTVQGRYLISDENGYVCDVMLVDPLTGCCPKTGEQFPCLGCNLASQCCDSYEYCVACCMSPDRTLSGLVTKVRIARQATAGNYGSVFDFCSGRCRHNSGSVVHENAYAYEEHHCFSLPSNMSVEQRKHDKEEELAGISIVISRQGQSCDSACKVKGQSCKRNKLPAINKCSALRKYFACKGSCTGSVWADQLGEVSSSARHLHPGACLFSAQESLLSCQGSHPEARRLCPCG